MTAVAVGIFLILAPLAFSQETATEEAETVAFQVCEQSPSWTRPLEDVQTMAWNFPRYGWSRAEGKASYEWNHFSFLYYGSASLAFDVRNLAGLWTASDVERPCENSEHQEQILSGQQVGLWILLHQAKLMERQGAVYTVTVQPTDKGFQRVDFPRPPGPAKNLTLIFQDPDGKEIDRVIEGVSPWTNDRERSETSRPRD